MLKEVVDIIEASNPRIADGALFCSDITVDAQTKKCIEFLEKGSVIENTDYDNKVGERISLELSLARLNGIGYYETSEKLVLKNKYSFPDKEFYVADQKAFSDDSKNEFYIKLKAVLSLMVAIEQVAQHTYVDVDVKNSLIFRDDKSLIISFLYKSAHIVSLRSEDVDNIAIVVSTLSGASTEKKLLFINELIDMLNPVTKTVRFEFLLNNVDVYVDKCNNAYQYYLRDFSYNKLKIELDSKALEFTQKIQSVINDSQTKLIAIPTAFVLVFASFDFEKLDSAKNIIAIISLFIFSFIIQLFLNNQTSSLKFTNVNIESYKETFQQKNIEKFNERFSLVKKELEKQKTRLLYVIIILWSLPAILLLTWLCLR